MEIIKHEKNKEDLAPIRQSAEGKQIDETEYQESIYCGWTLEPRTDSCVRGLSSGVNLFLAPREKKCNQTELVWKCTKRLKPKNTKRKRKIHSDGAISNS